MRLLTHNMLQCPRTKSYPLILTAKTCDDVEVPFSEEFIRRMVPRLNWPVFRSAAAQLPDPDTIAQLPEQPPEDFEATDEDVFKAIHRALLEWHVVDGSLDCQDGSARYAVRNGIPNLVITEVRQNESQSEQPDAAAMRDAAEPDQAEITDKGKDRE